MCCVSGAGLTRSGMAAVSDMAVGVAVSVCVGVVAVVVVVVVL